VPAFPTSADTRTYEKQFCELFGFVGNISYWERGNISATDIWKRTQKNARTYER